MPGVVGSYLVAVAVYDGSNNLITQALSTAFTFQTSPGQLKLVMTSSTSVTAGDYCNLNLNIQGTNIVPTNGRITIMLPKWNPGTQSLAMVKSMVAYSASDFSVANLGYMIDCTSSGQPSIKCILQPVTSSSVSQIATTQDILIISGFSSAIS